MSHPASCHDPECPLTYREHLLTVQISPAATPTRAVNRTEGQPDEPASRTRRREKALEKDLPAYKSLRQQGYQPRSVHGADRLAATATSDHQINGVPDFS